jgi:hypothetical protein
MLTSLPAAGVVKDLANTVELEKISTTLTIKKCALVPNYICRAIKHIETNAQETHASESAVAEVVAMSSMAVASLHLLHVIKC